MPGPNVTTLQANIKFTSASGKAYTLFNQKSIIRRYTAAYWMYLTKPFQAADQAEAKSKLQTAWATAMSTGEAPLFQLTNETVFNALLSKLKND